MTVPRRAAADDVAPVKPVLRWIGGKAWVASMLATQIRRHCPIRYHEPFLGGGAVLLNMAADTPCIGSDINQGLITFWQQLKKNNGAVYSTLMTIVAQYGATKAGYLLVRDRFNRIGAHTSLWDAAAFLYLNVLCFNGIYRENSKGEFNVPFGDRDADAMPSLGDLQAVAIRIARTNGILPDANTSFHCQSFETSIAAATPKDAIYSDSPYYGTYAGYVKNVFGPQQQGMLANALQEAAQRGVYVFATNSDTPEIRCMYSWAHVKPLYEPRRVSCDGNRTKAKCVLIRSHPL